MSGHTEPFIACFPNGLEGKVEYKPNKNLNAKTSFVLHVRSDFIGLKETSVGNGTLNSLLIFDRFVGLWVLAQQWLEWKKFAFNMTMGNNPQMIACRVK